MSQRVKIVVTVPPDSADAVRHAMGDAGAGSVGLYSHCSYSNLGHGRFIPQEGANPHIGGVGQFESVEEERIEVICDLAIARKVVSAAIEAHPYEEVAYDIYPLLQLDDLP